MQRKIAFKRLGGQVRNMLMGIVIGFLVAGCAAATFTFKYYGLSVASYDGKLLAVTAVDDKDFSTCQNNNCVVMYSTDFFALKQDYLDTKNQLIEAQKQLSQCK